MEGLERQAPVPTPGEMGLDCGSWPERLWPGLWWTLYRLSCVRSGAAALKNVRVGAGTWGLGEPRAGETGELPLQAQGTGNRRGKLVLAESE